MQRRTALAYGLSALTASTLNASALAQAPSQTAVNTQAPPPAADADPYRWLEEVQGEKPLAWVRERNAATEQLLQGTPGFADLKGRIREVLDSKEQIPYVSYRGGWLYNLWRDAEHPRGLWRRTRLDSYRQAKPDWQTVIDIDALGKAEKENWVWAGAQALGPDYRYALVALSRGGADATVVREFDIEQRRFVEGGFALPEAKHTYQWADADTLWVGSDFGPGSLTDSGYPRVIKRWKRGTPLASAVTVFEGEKADVSVSVSVDRTPGHGRTFFLRALDFYNSREWLWQPDAQAAGAAPAKALGGQLVEIDKPRDANVAFDRDWAFVELRSDWTVGGRTWPRGSLLATRAEAYLKGERQFTALFTPTATRSLAGWGVSKRALLLNILDNVTSRLQEWTLPVGPEARWASRDVQAPALGSLQATSLFDPLRPDDPLGEHYWLNASGFLQPDTLALGRVGSDARETLKTRPSFFNAQGMKVEQRFATSRDGTRVPYFVIWPQGAKADGNNPTLLYGYGGFEVSLTPFYSGAVGRAWLERGGVYVLANIRGGGEFGPGWHQAAIKANKQKSYDDFAAVAEDLIKTQVTKPARLGIQGGSNGGLLVGAVMVQRPELFNAVVCQVPLLDMRRYHTLLAGASWMAEYGDPDKASDWAVIGRYSPYQNVKAGVKMPRVLFVTSTRDDRVHPGHARKMAARMLEQGHAVLYWENIEGGHGGAADNGQRAQMSALEYSFLWLQLAQGWQRGG